jgi:hypothetical protein
MGKKHLLEYAGIALVVGSSTPQSHHLQQHLFAVSDFAESSDYSLTSISFVLAEPTGALPIYHRIGPRDDYDIAPI